MPQARRQHDSSDGGGGRGNGDGEMTHKKGIYVDTPSSNAFVALPTQKTAAIADRIELNYSVAKAGFMWGYIFEKIYENDITVVDVKDPATSIYRRRGIDPAKCGFNKKAVTPPADSDDGSTSIDDLSTLLIQCY